MPNKGYKFTEEHKEKIRLSNIGKHVFSEESKEKIRLKMLGNKSSYGRIGEYSNSWKGDNVGNKGLHKWVREHLPVSDLCQLCYKEQPYDLANITGNYNRGFHNWLYLCRLCHRMIDSGKVQLHRNRTSLVKRIR